MFHFLMEAIVILDPPLKFLFAKIPAWSLPDIENVYSNDDRPSLNTKFS